MQSDSPNVTHADMPTGVSGKKVASIGFVVLLAIALFTYFVVPKFVTPFFAAKPRQTRELFATLEQALLAYRVQNGTFPPEDDLTHYRRYTKNLAKSHAVGMSTYRAANLTTPVAFLDPERIADPYALPDQYAPPAYLRGTLADGGEFAILVSAGPNLTYEIRPPDFHNVKNREELRKLLERHRFEAANGGKSRGDYYLALIVGPDKSVDSIDGIVIP